MDSESEPEDQEQGTVLQLQLRLENQNPLRLQNLLSSTDDRNGQPDVSDNYTVPFESPSYEGSRDKNRWVVGGESVIYLEHSDISHAMDRFLEIAKDPPPSPILASRTPSRFEVKDLIKLICSDSVPVALCLTTLSGLASKEKNNIFISLIRKTIKSQEEFQAAVMEQLSSKITNPGLSRFCFDIVGSYPFEDPVWLHGTKRSSISLCLMSSIVRLYASRNVRIEDVTFDDIPNDAVSDDFAHKHIKWLHKEVLKRINGLKNNSFKMNCLKVGICILNIFNVGCSKAVYEFLPFLTQHCNKLLQLVFLNIDRDLSHLEQPLSMEDIQHCNTPLNHLITPVQSRVKHLCYYASAGHQDSRQCSLIVGLTEKNSSTEEIHLQLQKLQTNIIQSLQDTAPTTEALVCTPGSEDNIRKNLEKMILNEVKFFDSIPLRWVFLRSAIQVQYPLPMLMKKSDIINLVASIVVLDNNEIEMFLKTFTSFGSLFYASDIPSLREIVITDIERFVTCLDKVYNHQDDTLSDYGLIAEDIIKNLINEDLKLFMAVVTSFQLAVPIMKSKICGNEKADDSKQKYYIPSMRRSPVIDGPLKDSLYICLDPKYIPGNLQVSLTRSFLKYSNCFLVPSKPINITVIEVQHIVGREMKSVQVTVVDHGDVTEIRLDGCCELYSKTCKLSLGVCRAALENIKETLPLLQYHFAFCCQKEKEKFHYLEHSHNTESLCSQCQSINQCWLSAYTECSQQSGAQSTLLTPEEMTKLAIALSKEVLDSQKLEKLCTSLDVPMERIQTVIGWRQFLMLIMIWEEKASDCSKQNLLSILNQLGYNDL